MNYAFQSAARPHGIYPKHKNEITAALLIFGERAAGCVKGRRNKSKAASAARGFHNGPTKSNIGRWWERTKCASTQRERERKREVCKRSSAPHYAFHPHQIASHTNSQQSLIWCVARGAYFMVDQAIIIPLTFASEQGISFKFYVRDAARAIRGSEKYTPRVEWSMQKKSSFPISTPIKIDNRMLKAVNIKRFFATRDHSRARKWHQSYATGATPCPAGCITNVLSKLRGISQISKRFLIKLNAFLLREYWSPWKKTPVRNILYALQN